MKYFGLILILLIGLKGNAQSILNDFKYVIVPSKFQKFKSENQYNTSTIVKYYLSKNGLNAYYETALPEEVNTNRCKALYVSLDDQSNTFTTKVVVVFNDCFGQEKYRTQRGESRIKSYVEAYREAIGEAFNSLNGFQYRYEESTNPSPVIISFKDDVKKLPPVPKPEQTPEENEVDVIDSIPSVQDKEQTPLLPMPEEKVDEVTLEEAVALNKDEVMVFPQSLYAQKTETGYQLVDTTPSIQIYLHETSLPNVFLAERKGERGILFLEGEKWIFEFYRGADRMQEEMQIKF